MRKSRAIARQFRRLLSSDLKGETKEKIKILKNNMGGWHTEGCFPGRVPILYTGKENSSGELVFSSPDSRPVERKFRDLLQWVNESLPEGKLLSRCMALTEIASKD